MSSSSIINLIGDVSKQNSRRAGYGRCRNHVILEAMLTGSDVLLFIDTDVFPELIIRDVDKLEDKGLDIRPSGIDGVSIQEVDFIGGAITLGRLAPLISNIDTLVIVFKNEVDCTSDCVGSVNG